jgi:hypothetical protein
MVQQEDFFTIEEVEPPGIFVPQIHFQFLQPVILGLFICHNHHPL